MNTLVVIQARLGSTRLPGKVLLPLGGKPVLQWVVERAQRAGYPVVVAVPAENFAAIVRRCRDDSIHPIRISHGPSNDVLARYARVAQDNTPDIVVRLTADCPFVDPDLIRAAVDAIARGHDYAGNTVERHWPRGLDVEAFTTDLLIRAHQEAVTPYDREHVTPWMQRHATHPYALPKTPEDAPGVTNAYRWCLDTPEDYRWLQGAINALGDPTMAALAEYSRLHPPPLDPISPPTPKSFPPPTP